MLKHRSAARDPFSFFSSSSPDRHFTSPKSQSSPKSAMHVNGLRKVDLTYLLSDLCSQLEKAQSSSPVRSPSVDSSQPRITVMSKTKSRPVKALALSSVKATSASRMEKRRRRAADAAQSTNPPLLPSPSFPRAYRSDTSPRKPLRIPAIVIRPASPSLSASSTSASVSDQRSAACAKCPSPGYIQRPVVHSQRDMRLLQLETEIVSVKIDLDTVLSKFLHPKLSTLARSISSELLRLLSKAICRVDGLGDVGRKELLPNFLTQIFRHIITGVFHLLDDSRAPYHTAHSAAQLCWILSRELHMYVAHVNREDKTNLADWTKDEAQFDSALTQELEKILHRGMQLSNKYNRLTLPGEAPPKGKCQDTESQVRRLELRRGLARQGDLQDVFVGVDVVRFIGEAFLLGLTSNQVLTSWLERFLLHTVHPDIPSAWEIECACALIITVGEHLDNGIVYDGGIGGSSMLDPWMRRVDFLVLHGDISSVARDWLIQLQMLRSRKWKLATA